MTDLIERLKDGETYTDAVDEAIDEIEKLRSTIESCVQDFRRLFRLLRYFVRYFDMHRVDNEIISEAKSILYDVNGLPEQYPDEEKIWNE